MMTNHSADADLTRPPVRIVHLGLGAFHRAHQVWFTQRADPDWGIAAFAGRSNTLADTLRAQDCRYPLVERGPDADTFHQMTALVRAYGADRAELFNQLVADPDVAVLTLTVTEDAYRPDPADVIADAAALRGGGTPHTVPGRLLAALRARRLSGAGPIAVVPCDNLLANGARIRAALFELATGVDRDLAAWLADQVSFVDTVSDRITPATTGGDLALVASATGLADRAPVVTEPFAEWILSGEFPAGRPAWERAGAVIVDDIRPFERRKLRLLNGAHLLLALTGPRRGHDTVAEAMADPVLRRLTEEYWASATHGVPQAGAYLQQLRTRFDNARICHSLLQITMGAEAKLRERIVPLVDELLANGADPTPALRVVAAWLTHTGEHPDQALDRLAPGWATAPELRRHLDRAATDLSRLPSHPCDGASQ